MIGREEGRGGPLDAAIRDAADESKPATDVSILFVFSMTLLLSGNVLF